MAFPGWLKFGGSEIINIERTTTYIRSLMPQLQVAPARNCEDVLHQVLGQKPYTTPMDDNAPWYDVKVPESHGFAGFYPLAITGLDDDVRTATVTQGNFDGGFISSARRKTREVRVSGLLVGETESCVDYGLFWLRQMLDSDVRRAKIGRMDPTGSETMASIPDLCGEERGDVQFLASCPELGCGQHCGHQSGKETAHPVDLSKMVPNGGIFQSVGGQWIFTPDNVGVLKTPDLPDTETCPVRYEWLLLGEPGSDVAGQGIRDGDLRYSTAMDLTNRRTNLAENPQWKRTNGTTVVRKNLAVNPSLRTLCAPTVIQTNRVPNPRAGTSTSGWQLSSGTGGTSGFTRFTTGGPLPNAPTYIEQKWTVAQTAFTSPPYTSVGLNGDATYEIPVVAGEKVSGSVYAMTSVANQNIALELLYYNSANTQVGSTVIAPTTTPSANVWTYYGITDPNVVPATATKVRLILAVVSGSMFAVNSTLRTSAWNLSRNQRLISPYFDGATNPKGGQSYAWTGTAHASPSTATGYMNLIRTNTSQNPACKNNVTGYGTDTGGATVNTTLATNSPLVTGGIALTNYAHAAWATAPTDQSAITMWFGRSGQGDLQVQAGQRMIFSCYARTNVFDRTAIPEVTYYQDNGNAIVTRVGTTPFGIGGTVFTRVWLFDPSGVPVGASRARLALRPSGSVFVVGDSIDMTGTMGEISQDGVLGGYFDGSATPTSTTDYEWAGAAQASSSYAYSTLAGGRTVARTNYFPNPEQNAKFPSFIASWNSGAYPVTQDAALNRTLTTRTATSPSTTVSQVSIGGASAQTLAAPGETWTLSCDLTTTADDRAYSAQVSFNPGGAGTVVSGTVPVAGSTVGPIRVAATGTAPAGTTSVYLTITVTTNSGNAPTGEVVYFDNILFEKVNGVRTYFSGDFISPSNSGLACQWEGAPHQSRSLAVGPCLNKTLVGVNNTPFWQSDNASPAGGAVGSAFVVGDSGTGTDDSVPLRTNLAKNPVGRAVSGTVEARRNRVLNPAGRSFTGTQEVRRNYVTNPSFETDTAGWSTFGAGTPTLTRVTGTPAAFAGTQSMRVAYTNTLSGAQLTVTGLTVGVVYTASAYIWNPTGNPSVALQINGIGTSTRTNTNDQWHRLMFTFTATATSHLMQIGVLGTGGTNEFYVDAVMVDAASGPLPYFDGSTPDTATEDYGWVGTAGSSASTLTMKKINNWAGTAPGTVSQGPAIATSTSTSGFGMDLRSGPTFFTSLMTSAAAVGEFYSGRVTVRFLPNDSVVPAGSSPAVIVRIHDGTGYITPAGPDSGAWLLPTDGSPLTIEAVANAAVASPAQPRIYVYPHTQSAGGTNTPAPSVTLRITEAQMEKVAGFGYPLASGWFDGATTNTADLTYGWSGTADASESTATASKPVLDSAPTFPAVYRSPSHAQAAGEYAIVAMPGGYIDLNRTAGDATLNGHKAGAATTISMYAFKDVSVAATTQDLRLQLWSKPSAGSLTAQEKIIPVALDGRVSATFTVPTDAVCAFWRVQNYPGEVLYVSEVLIENSPAAGTYFDGGFTDIPGTDYNWTGTADQSYSTVSAISRLIIQGAGDTAASPNGWYAARVKVRQIGATPEPTNTIHIDGHFYGAGDDYGNAVQAVDIVVTDQWQEVCLSAYQLAPSVPFPTITWNGVNPATTWDSVPPTATWDNFTGP